VFVSAPFLDELFAGGPTLGAAQVRAELGLGYATLAAAVLALPLFTALVVEAPLFLLAARLGRRRLAAASLATFAVTAAFATMATSPLALAACFAVASPASGIALGLVQASQLDRDPTRREHWMTRWTLAASLGDLAAPVMLALVTTIGFGWRATFVPVSLALAALAVVTWRAPEASFTLTEEADDEELSMFAGVRRAARTPRLLLWTLGVQLCDLLDEIFVIFAALFLHEVRGASAQHAMLVLFVGALSCSLGLVVTERALRRASPRALLVASSILCAASLVGFVLLPGRGAELALVFALGFFSAPLYPLAKAQAYSTLPDAPDVVNATGSAFTTLAVVLPVCVAWLAERWGLDVAMLALCAQPLGLLLLASLVRTGVCPHPSGESRIQNAASTSLRCSDSQRR
jgi:MFS family permease